MSESIVASRLLFALLTVACLAVWAVVWRKWRERKPAIEYEPRREVPWSGLEVSGCLLIGILVPILFSLSVNTSFEDDTPADQGALTQTVGFSAHAARRDDTADGPSADDDRMESTAHPVARLLSERHDLATLLVCLLAAVAVAPLFEEFFFRVLLQGWLEAREDGWRRRLPVIGRFPRGGVPIFLSAALFALMHVRGEEVQFDPERTMSLLVVDGAGKLLAAACAIVLLRASCRATMADLGLCWKRLRGDAMLGFAALAAVFVPINALQLGLYMLQTQLRESHLADNLVAPDPVPLFFFALVAGYLYQRTHRLAPGVVLHMAFNAIPLMTFWLGSVTPT